MKRIRFFAVMMSFLVIFFGQTSVFAGSQENFGGKKAIDPIWIHIGEERVESSHNPGGDLVIYGIDRASAKIHSSNKDLGFWLAKVTKAKNEVELTYIRLSKDKKTYTKNKRQVKRIYYLDDGSLKSVVKEGESVHPVTGNEKFLKAEAIVKNNSLTVSDMDMPSLPAGFNKMEPKNGKAAANGKKGFEGYRCFTDEWVSGTDPRDANRLIVVTYAYNTPDRIYYKGETYCERTGENSYKVTGGKLSLYTYEDKLLEQKTTNQSYVISESEFNSFVRYMYEMK